MAMTLNFSQDFFRVDKSDAKLKAVVFVGKIRKLMLNEGFDL